MKIYMQPYMPPPDRSEPHCPQCGEPSNIGAMLPGSEWPQWCGECGYGDYPHLLHLPPKWPNPTPHAAIKRVWRLMAGVVFLLWGYLQWQEGHDWMKIVAIISIMFAVAAFIAATERN